MPNQRANELKQCLFDAYDGFADKRYKDISRDSPFIVDDRGEGDYDAKGRLFLWFCQMFATVKNADTVHLWLRGGTPVSDDVTAWFKAHNAEPEADGVGFDLRPDTVADLEDLAVRFEGIIRKRYDTKAYKYVVPRVAASLRSLQDVLEAAWS